MHESRRKHEHRSSKRSNWEVIPLDLSELQAENLKATRNPPTEDASRDTAANECESGISVW